MAMLRVLPPTTLATNNIAASWVNTNFRLGKITGVGTPYTEVTSLAAKQVCFGPVKAQQGTTCTNFVAKCGTILYFVQQLFTTCSNLICCKDIGILQSSKTTVSRSDWRYSKSAFGG